MYLSLGLSRASLACSSSLAGLWWRWQRRRLVIILPLLSVSAVCSFTYNNKTPSQPASQPERHISICIGLTASSSPCCTLSARPFAAAAAAAVVVVVARGVIDQQKLKCPWTLSAVSGLFCVVAFFCARGGGIPYYSTHHYTLLRCPVHHWIGVFLLIYDSSIEQFVILFRI